MTQSFIFDEAKHEYKLNGQILPSVTEICKLLSIHVAENAKSWLRDTAANRGTRVHQYCADIDMQDSSDKITVDYDCTGYVNAYFTFLRDYMIHSWLAIEMPVYSELYGVAGTIDRIGVIDNKLIILDIKTGSTIDKAILTAQLNGYSNILPFPDCNYKLKYDREIELWGLQLKKDGNYRIIKCEKSPIFSMLKLIYDERNRILCRNRA